MLKDIDTIDPQSGRILKEDNLPVNIADFIERATDLTGGIYVNDESQHAIHSGDSYSFDYDGTLAGSTSLYFMGITGDKQVHFDEISGNFQKGGIRLWLYETPATTANGTAQTPANMNFASTNTTTLSLYSAPTITDNGTKKLSRYFPLTGVGVNVIPQSGSIAGGRVLKANTKYLFRVENTDLTSCSFGINFVWHDDNTVLGG